MVDGKKNLASGEFPKSKMFFTLRGLHYLWIQHKTRPRDARLENGCCVTV